MHVKIILCIFCCLCLVSDVDGAALNTTTDPTSVNTSCKEDYEHYIYIQDGGILVAGCYKCELLKGFCNTEYEVEVCKHICSDYSSMQIGLHITYVFGIFALGFVLGKYCKRCLHLCQRLCYRRCHCRSQDDHAFDTSDDYTMGVYVRSRTSIFRAPSSQRESGYTSIVNSFSAINEPNGIPMMNRSRSHLSYRQIPTIRRSEYVLNENWEVDSQIRCFSSSTCSLQHDLDAVSSVSSPGILSVRGCGSDDSRPLSGESSTSSTLQESLHQRSSDTPSGNSPHDLDAVSSVSSSGILSVHGYDSDDHRPSSCVSPPSSTSLESLHQHGSETSSGSYTTCDSQT